MEVGGRPHASVALPPGKEHLVPIRYEAGWAQSRSGLHVVTDMEGGCEYTE